MSLKAELETWASALKAYDEENFEKALDLFTRIADSSKILTNMGLIYATLGEHEAAVERFIEATNLDQYLAVAYFQCGVSNFLLTRYDMALKDFEEAYLYLRGNQDINYEQLGLKFRLYSAEVLFNKGLSLIYLGRVQEGMADMEEARRQKITEEHNVIDDAIQDRGEGYTVFSIPVGVLYRPSEKKLKNAVTKDYMGKAKLVAASDPGDAYTEFTGVARMKQGISPTGVYIDRPDMNLGRSASASAAVTSPTPPSTTDGSRSAGLERSKTTLNVPANARELTSPKPSPSSARPPADLTPTNARPLGSNATTPTPTPGIGGPVRGLSVRRTSPQRSPQPQSPVSAPPRDPRVTEFLDDYLDSYTTEQPPAPPIRSGGAPPAAPDRVAAWARSNADPNLMRSGSRSAPASNYAPSSFGGSTVRRRTTRRTVRQPSRVQSPYEEEEGYASGDYEDPFEIIRVKIHYQDDVRGMTLNPDTPFEEFVGKLTTKFEKNFGDMSLKFVDEDGVKVTLRDDSDYELAVETARSTAKGKPEGKMVIWMIDN